MLLQISVLYGNNKQIYAMICKQQKCVYNNTKNSALTCALKECLKWKWPQTNGQNGVSPETATANVNFFLKLF